MYADPFARFERLLAEVDRLSHHPATAPALPLTVWGTDDAVLVVADAPGVAKADVTIEATADTLTVSGSRRPDEPRANDRWVERERRHGSFTRTIQLPWRIDPDRIEARLADGRLSIALVRDAADRPRKIAVTN